MDKYEYKLKTEQMLELMEDGAFNKAAEIADTIDWRRVRNATMLTNVSDIYEKNKDYQKSYEVLNIAYQRAEGSRKIVYRLCSLALKTRNVDEAIDYYDEFIQIAPKDPNQYILKYQILRAQRAPIEQQIEALEEFKKAEYIEEWAYELAKLYQEAGMTAECLEECDDLILWFSEGKYVYQAMELKMQYKPLTPSQQEKYDHRYEKISSETEEMPDLSMYKKEEELSVEQVEEELQERIEESDKELYETGKKKIGNTMKLDEALKSLLNLDMNVEEGEESQGEQVSVEVDEDDIGELQGAIEEIESVVDLDLVQEVRNEKEAKNVALDPDLEELIPESEEESKSEEVEATEESGLEKIEAEEEPEEVEAEAKSSDNSGEIISTVKTTDQESDQIEGQMSLEDLLGDWPSSADDAEDTEEALAEDLITEVINESEDEPEKEEVTEKKEKMGEPILPPDIQQLIDEIEGGISPVKEEEIAKPAVSPKVKMEKRENMGAVADSLRIDDELEDELEDELPEEIDEDFDGDLDEEYDEADAEEYEEIDEADAEEYEEIDEADAEEYEEIDEADAEEFDEAEEYEDADSVGEWLKEEFSPALDSEDAWDDREIPDEEDDEVDILTATTPLSRKETAKLIATGKTAPLPVGEITDALSISDTGFIVHARYDFQAKNRKGGRMDLTEEQKKLFSYFVPVRGMSEQLVDVLEQDKNCTNRKGTSCTGNLLIIGNKGNGKTVLAVDVVKAIQKQRKIRQGKVAIVTGDSLNKKKISDIVSKLYGGALIIEKAGKMNEKTVAKLNRAMERDTGEMLIVLEDQRKPLDRLLSSNREFRRKFTSRLEVPILINDELVTFGQTYAQENGYRIDEMGILALYSRIDNLQREDHAVTIAEVKEVMDEAITHSQKASAKKLVRRVFGRNTDEADRILLTERDFNI